VACPISEPLAIWDIYRMEEFFIGEDLFVSLLKETALEVILFFIVLFSVVSLNPIFFAVALRGVAFIFSRAGAAGNKIIIIITNPRITKRDINFLSILNSPCYRFSV